MGPELAFSEDLHAQKYRGEGESFREAMNRVATALSDDDGHYKEFREILLDMRFMPGGRIQSSMGSTRQTTPYNCFVSGTIEDSFIDGTGSIMSRATEAASTMRLGGGIGYDFSTLRPKGDLIRKLNSQSSGPLSFMRIFSEICLCIASSGHRRGAQMGILRVDHPDIEEFVHAKQNQGQLNGFNMSIAVTDSFMEHLMVGRPFPLQFGGRIYRHVDPQALWDMIMRSTWDWAEPGVIFIDTINRMNNLYYCEQIAATNPCGEQPLPPHGACLLGSVNLTKYVTGPGPVELSAGDNTFNGRSFEMDQMIEDLSHVVRAMDNVIDRAIYPLYEQEKEAKSKRRMGIGVTGMANAVEALGHPYGSPEYVAMEERILQAVNLTCYSASAMLARERGSFPMYDEGMYLKSRFIRRLPHEIQDLIKRNGIRNSHLTSIAPTGTISLCADNISSGIEPVFDYKISRTIQTFDGPVVEPVEDYGTRVFNTRGKRSSDVSVKEHLAVLSAAYRHVDSAVSKTCNVDSSVAWDDFKQVYIDAWEQGCKGCTTFRIDGMRGGVIETREDDSTEEPVEGLSCRIDDETGRRECE